MTLLFAAAGALIGGMMFKFIGVLTGALLGWLSGTLHDLRQRQGATERELVWLRKSLTEHLHEATGNMMPATDTPPAAALAANAETIPDIIELEDVDLLQEDDRLSPAAEPISTLRPIHEPDTSPMPNYSKPRPVHEPAKAETFSAFQDWLSNIASGENMLVKLGVLILFLGVSFLVKYAAQHGFFPIELRLTAAALGGGALLATGWHVRGKRPVYAQVIQGGGTGILYLTTYASLQLYHLIPVEAGFALLVAVCALSAVLAVLQDSLPLAVMGSAGGFLAPELAGVGSENPAMLFGFYAILNCGIFGIARRRAWSELNLLGFVGTFIVSALWGNRFYRPEYFFTIEPFLVLFFLIYAVLPALNDRRQPTALENCIDFSLVFGTPIVAFAFQAALVRQYEYGLAWSALSAGVFYITLAGWLFRREPARMRNLAEAYLAMGTVLGTLAIPLAFEGRWTSAAWSVEGAALVWAGLHQERRLARAFGFLLLIGSGAMFLNDVGLSSGVWPVLNSFYIGSLLVSGAALFSARLLGRSKSYLEEYERFAEPALFAWGMIWWFVGGFYELGEHTVSNLTFGAALTFVAASCYVCTLLRHRLDWELLEWPSLGLLPAMAGFALLQLLNGSSFPSIHGGWFGWPLALAVWYLILHSSGHRQPQLPTIVHAAPFWLLTLLAAWELSGRVAHHLPGMETWAVCTWGVVPALMVLLISLRGYDLPWPVEGNLTAYLRLGSAPLALAAWLWLLYANLTQAGNSWPLPYLPLVNPLDGATLLVVISLAVWYRAIKGSLPDLDHGLPLREAAITFAATLFVWLNAILLRSIHHWCGVPFTPRALFVSLTVQTTLSICWSLLALAVMTIATRRGMRLVWLAGACLLGAVVAKLFLVDLSGQGSVARIVSFVVVGLLVLLIGWFSPVPPRATIGGAP